MRMGKKNKQKAMWERMEELVRQNMDYEQFCEGWNGLQFAGV